MSCFYFNDWPIGTVRFSELPPTVKTDLEAFIDVEGYIDSSLEVHRTATEGPYIEFNGYKVRATIETVTPTMIRVKIE